MGGAEAIKTKIKSFAHTEFDNPEVLDNVNIRLENLKDVLGRLYEYKVVPIDETFPEYVRKNIDEFSHLIYQNES